MSEKIIVNHTATVKKEYAAVDIFKFICSILVIAIHAKPFINNFWLDAGVGLLTRFAVPYFFLSSAYFLFKKLFQCSTAKEKGRCYLTYFLRLLRFYGIWFVVFNVCDLILGGSIHSVFWYVKQFVVPSNGSSLWFVAALIWASLIVFLATLIMNPKLVLGISIFFLLLGYCLSTLLAVTGNFIVIKFLNTVVVPYVGGVQNGLFFAFPYVVLGAVMVNMEIQKAHRRNFIFAIACFILLGVESVVAVVVLNAPLTFLWLSALPMTYFIMKLTLTIDIKEHASFYYLRKMSTLIYVFHSVLIKFITKLFEITPLGSFDTQNLLFFITTVMVTVGISYLIVRLSKIQKFSFLKYIM